MRLIIASTLCVMVMYSSVETKKNLELYNIVLIGATGDLAKKYLWKALFNLFNKKFVKDKVRVQSILYFNFAINDTDYSFLS